MQAKQQLAQRLAIDITNDTAFWTNAELGIYICQALRMYNCLTLTWRQDFTFFNTGPVVWNSLATLAGSPRIRTSTDVDAYVQLEYMLLEVPSGSTWNGTNQFSISDLAQALQRRRDEMLQISAANDSLMTDIGSTPGVSRILLPDTVIDVPRLRFIPVDSTNNAGVTLYRDDAVALEFYEAPIYELPPQTPQTFSLSSEPPLSFDVYPPPNVAGTYEAVVLQSGPPLIPVGDTVLLNIPDDFTWVLYWGALADLLGRESEAVDRERAEYAQKRYLDGLLILEKTPWIMLGKVNGAAVSVDALAAADRYSPEFDSDPSGFGPMIVTAGMDFFASPTNAAIGITCLGNAPTPVLDADWVQVSRSNWEVVILLAQVFATFKQGGQEWKQSLELERQAIQSCDAERSRLKSMGAFSDILDQRGEIEDMNQARYNSPQDKKG